MPLAVPGLPVDTGGSASLVVPRWLRVVPPVRPRRSPPSSRPRRIGRWAFRVVLAYCVLWIAVNGGILLVSRMAAMRTATPPAPAAVRSVGHVVAVDAHLWRSAAPATDAQYEGFRRLGVTTVIDLRQLDRPAAHAEALRLRRLGLRSVVIPVPDGGIPSRGQVRRFLQVVEGTPGGVLVHCGAGVGRTGAMVAAYLVATGQADGRQAMMRSLSVGPPSLEQLAFEYQLGRGHDPGGQPSVVIRVVSRLFDEPRLAVNHLLG